MNKLRVWLAYYILPKDTRKYLIKALSDAAKELEKDVAELMEREVNLEREFAELMEREVNNDV